MNGAESLVRTLVNAGVEVCFANPGTSEMHFVAALDKVGGIRCILGLFEGVVTGAADGYARMAEKPGVSLLHTGPGLANGLANLHNAKKSSTSMSSDSAFLVASPNAISLNSTASGLRKKGKSSMVISPALTPSR